MLDSHIWLVSFCRQIGVPSTSTAVNAINDAWFVWGKREELGKRATKRKLRQFLGRLARSGAISHRLLRKPRTLFKFFALGALVRVPRL